MSEKREKFSELHFLMGSYIFRRDNLLELVERELRLALPHIVPEDCLQPLDVVPGERAILDFAGDANNEGHKLLHGVDGVLVLVNAGQQLWNNSLAVPDLNISVLQVWWSDVRATNNKHGLIFLSITPTFYQYHTYIYRVKHR